jgi:hypothetical protein
MRYQMALRAPDFCLQKVGRLSEWKQIININGTKNCASKVFIAARARAQPFLQDARRNFWNCSKQDQSGDFLLDRRHFSHISYPIEEFSCKVEFTTPNVK